MVNLYVHTGVVHIYINPPVLICPYRRGVRCVVDEYIGLPRSDEANPNWKPVPDPNSYGQTRRLLLTLALALAHYLPKPEPTPPSARQSNVAQRHSYLFALPGRECHRQPNAAC